MRPSTSLLAYIDAINNVTELLGTTSQQISTFQTLSMVKCTPEVVSGATYPNMAAVADYWSILALRSQLINHGPRTPQMR
jgi:hypothetical protein